MPGPWCAARLRGVACRRTSRRTPALLLTPAHPSPPRRDDSADMGVLLAVETMQDGLVFAAALYTQALTAFAINGGAGLGPAGSPCRCRAPFRPCAGGALRRNAPRAS
jgi:hypothetical protein